MPSIEELLSEHGDLKAKFMVNIKPGLVFRVFDNRTTPPKPKYHVIVGICEEEVLIGTVRINSQINTNVYRRIEEQYRCLKLKEETYHFLKHNSIVDCNILIPSRMNGIKQYLENNSTCILGELKVEDLEEIKLRMIEAPTISKEDKVKFGIIEN